MRDSLIIAGTGHRPKYCPCKYKNNHPWLINLKKRLENYLIEMGFGDTKRIIRAGEAKKMGIDIVNFWASPNE